MTCNNCGKENFPGAVVCDVCGMPQQAAPIPDYAQPQAPQAPLVYVPPVQGDEPVSMGTWIGIWCLNLIPCVGSLIYLIMLFVWAFGNDRRTSLKNYAKAQLLISLISVVIGIVIGIVFGTVIAATVSDPQSILDSLPRR